jgi:hypothetical protein
MSVDIAAIAGDPARSLRGYPEYGLVSLQVQDLTALGLAVVAAPLADNPAHAHVVGAKSKSAKTAMARKCVWVRRIPGMPGDTEPPIDA